MNDNEKKPNWKGIHRTLGDNIALWVSTAVYLAIIIAALWALKRIL